ncbi:hypothetical protein QJQ45_016295 [Haematococcus lacustris]|nr:hypothetical protein QJQ45_016295 [Haematococcus lacustris]
MQPCVVSKYAAAALLLPHSAMSLAGKKVVIIGGTGRVGSSTASCILRSFPDVNVTIAGRSKSSYDDAISRRPDLAKCRFQQVDIASPSSVKVGSHCSSVGELFSDTKSNKTVADFSTLRVTRPHQFVNPTCVALKAAMSGIDLIIHAAGPFQQTKNHIVLEQAIDAKVAYVDVCDDLHYSEESKALYGKAAADAGVPAIISAGIYPGTSNVMAAHIISIAKGEYDENWQYRTPEAGQGEKPKLLRYSYYTAGSGGAGPTILQTSFLLAGEPVVVYKEGQRFELPPISNRREVDFGPGIGRKGVYLYNLPECESAYKYLGVPGVSARFGTDPFIWNWAMWLMARAMPRKLLNDRTFVKSFASLSEPAVRLVDKWAGEAVAMKIEVDFESGKNSSGIFVHRLLGQSMGYSVAGFAQAVLLGQTKPGVWYPEPSPLVGCIAALWYCKSIELQHGRCPAAWCDERATTGWQLGVNAHTPRALRSSRVQHASPPRAFPKLVPRCPCTASSSSGSQSVPAQALGLPSSQPGASQRQRGSILHNAGHSWQGLGQRGAILCAAGSPSLGLGTGNDPQPSGQQGLGDSASVGQQVLAFQQAFWKFLRPHTIRGTILGTSALTARALLESPGLIDWGLLPKALMGLLALLCGNGFIVGINQVYDVEIDMVNKPFLPVASGKHLAWPQPPCFLSSAPYVRACPHPGKNSRVVCQGELSPALASLLCALLAGTGMALVARNFGNLITGLYSFGLLLGTVYSVPPLRLKRFAIPAFLIIATVRGFLLNFGVYYATRAALGAPFIWSPAITFITSFVTLFAVVIAVTKDLPDVEGDSANNIQTFATRMGVKTVSLGAVSLLLANYGVAMWMALQPHLGFNTLLMFGGHAALALLLAYRTARLDAAKYSRDAILGFYRWVWTLFYCEYAMFPFI